MTEKEKDLLMKAFRLICSLQLSWAWQDCDIEADDWLQEFAKLFPTGLEPDAKD